MRKVTKSGLKGLKRSGIYYGQIISAPTKSIRTLFDNLLPHEKIIKIASCSTDDNPGGALVVTTLRVAFAYSSSISFEETFKDFQLLNITSISAQSKLTNSLTIYAGSDKIKLKHMDRSALKEIGQALRNPASFNSYSPEELFTEEVKSSRGSIGKKVLIGFVGFFLFLLILAGLSDNEPIEKEPTTAEASTSQYTYTVINENEVQGMKKSLDIRLEKELSEEELETLANEIKSNIKGQYQNIFISYYLHSMEVGEGAWATTHFTPSLQVKILDFIDHGN